METVLITGGTGMIGKALTQALIERGFQVTIMTLLASSYQHLSVILRGIKPIKRSV